MDFDLFDICFGSALQSNWLHESVRFVLKLHSIKLQEMPLISKLKN
jgi:hypothetical protein